MGGREREYFDGLWHFLAMCSNFFPFKKNIYILSIYIHTYTDCTHKYTYTIIFLSTFKKKVI